MYPENPEGTQVIVGSMNMGYISDTARNRTHNLFRLKWELIPLGHSDGLHNSFKMVPIQSTINIIMLHYNIFMEFTSSILFFTSN